MSGIQTPYNLFTDPTYKEQFSHLPKDQQEQYKKAGEYIYSRDVNNDLDSNIKNAIEYIKLGLRSGLLPSCLSDDERNLMRNIVGPEWFKEFGFPSDNYNGLS